MANANAISANAITTYSSRALRNSHIALALRILFWYV
jgi:hypothetical protein